MATLVVDASVAIKWVLNEDGHLPARDLLRTFVSGENDLVAPRTLPEEVSSALAKRVRTKHLTSAAAIKAFEFLERYMPTLESDRALTKEALLLSLRLQLGLWDCLYLALAIRGRYTLITADRRLYRGAIAHYPYVEMLA
ncbi:MAG: type II toxin-antitoxin system VapC family toxin [Bryobacteraceae bacterium]